MTNVELNALTSVKSSLPAIAKELAKTNKLKALELRIRLAEDKCVYDFVDKFNAEIDDIMAAD